MQAEGEIVQLLTEGVAPPKDFRMFFEEEHGRLFKTLYFVTGDRADAADLMQEAFAKLWERWDTIDRIDDPTAYLFKVALNGNRMRLRAARRAARRPIPLGIVRDPFDEVDIREDVFADAPGPRPTATSRPRPARSVRIRLRRGRTDHGHPSVDRPRAGHARSGRAPPRRRPRCMT
jgi:RNA polymerase sigma factor (sigma-70 family)